MVSSLVHTLVVVYPAQTRPRGIEWTDMPPKKSTPASPAASSSKSEILQAGSSPMSRSASESDAKKPALGMVKPYSMRMLSLPQGYPKAQEPPFKYIKKEASYLGTMITERRDLGLYIFSWLEASTMARCQSVAKVFKDAEEGLEGFIEAAAKLAPKLRDYRYSDVLGVQKSRKISVTHALSVLEALEVPLLYLVGGYNHRRLSTKRTLKRFLPWLNTYKELAPMITPRRELGACLVDNELFALGGVYGLTSLGSMERFNPVKNVWQEFPKMKHARRACAATALNRKLYAIGGYNLARSMESVECFDLNKNKWEEVASMNNMRSGCCAAAAMGAVYVFGGGDNCKVAEGTWAFATGEKYDVEKNTWTYIAEMTHPRRGGMAATVGNKIYLRGGKNNRNEDVLKMECYDPQTNLWEEVDHIEPPEGADVFEQRLVMEFERADGCDMIDGIAASGCICMTSNFIGSGKKPED